VGLLGRFLEPHRLGARGVAGHVCRSAPRVKVQLYFNLGSLVVGVGCRSLDTVVPEFGPPRGPRGPVDAPDARAAPDAAPATTGRLRARARPLPTAVRRALGSAPRAPVSRGLVGRPSCDAVAASRSRAVAVLSRAAGEAARTLVGRGLCGPAVPRERDANSSRTA